MITRIIDLFKRIGTTISPTVANDNIDIGTGTLTSGLLKLPTTTSLVGQLQINSVSMLHNYGGNLFLGKAGNFVTTATDNIGIGFEAFENNFSGTGIAIGYRAGRGNVNGIRNTYIGYEAGLSGTTGVTSVTITNGGTGYTAGNLVVDNTGTSGSGFAGTYTVTGGVITGITVTNRGTGYRTAPVVTGDAGGSGAVLTPVLVSADNNSAMGVSALRFNTTGGNNSAMGFNALTSNTTGGNNSAMGVGALRFNTTGGNNSAMGFESFRSNTTGGSNSAMGVSALFSNTTGGNNSAMGVNALFSNTTGGSNSAIGRDAGRFITDGVTTNAITNNSIFIGNLTKAKADNETNQIVIGYDAIGNGTNTATIGDDNITALYAGELGQALVATPEIKTNVTADTDLTITTGTAKTLVLATPVYKDINIAGALLGKPASSAPDTDTFRTSAPADTGIETYAFDIGEKVHGGFEIQHDYKEGTDLVFHVHFQIIAAPTTTDYVQWRLTYVTLRDGVTLGGVATIDTDDLAVDTQYRSYRSDFGAISGTNYKIGDQFMFTLERVAADGDAFAGDCLIETAGIHYQVDTLGSRTIGAK